MTFLNFTIPSSSPMISYTGEWQDGSTVNGTCASNSLLRQGTTSVMSNDGDATATLTFLGTNITIYGEKPDSGSYFVSLDNGPAFNANDEHGDNITPQFPKNSNNTTSHTVAINNGPTPNGSTFLLNCISIGRDIGPPGYNSSILNVKIDDEWPSISYIGEWSSFSSTSAYNSSIHSTSNKGDTASFEFHGSSIELYGNGASFQVQVDDQLPTILVGPPFIPQSQPSSTLLFYTDNLGENETHIIILTNFQFEPLFFDFAIIRGASGQNVSGITQVPQDTNFDDQSTGPSISIGTIIGSAVGASGFIILCLIGLYFLRRRRRIHKLRHYRSTVLTDDSVDAEDTPSGDTETPVAEVTPYMLPNMKVAQAFDEVSTPHPTNSIEFELEPGQANQDPNSNSPEMDSHQIPALFTLTDSEIVESSPQHQDQLVTNARTPEPNAHFQNLSNRFQEEYLVDEVRERDAGRVTIASSTRSRLPPAYNESWSHSRS